VEEEEEEVEQETFTRMESEGLSNCGRAIITMVQEQVGVEPIRLKEVDFSDVGAKFWNQEVRGLTNKEVMGCMRKDVQDIILSQVQRKRIMKEGPHEMACTWAERENKEKDEEDGENTTSAIEARQELGSSRTIDTLVQRQVGVRPIKAEEVEKVYAWCSLAMDTREMFWAQGCLECKVELERVKGPIQALLNSESEVDVVSKGVYEEGQWTLDRDNDWEVRTASVERKCFWGACPRVQIKKILFGL